MKKITLVTSIAPKNILNQKAAILSWMESGFRIISCNCLQEIEVLKDEFPMVEFVETERDATAVMGKPCPYIYDMLQILKQSKCEVGGIVNSDIHLRNFSKDMYEFLFQEAKSKAVFMRRHEVDTLDDAQNLNSFMYLGGIDAFFFSKGILHLLPDDNLILGQIMWDYWIPIYLDKMGIGIKELINPVIFHVRHSAQWDAGMVDNITKDLCEKYFPNINKEDSTSFLKEKFWEIISDTNLQICYVTDEMREKKVRIKSKKDNFNLQEQTHKNAAAGCGDESADYLVDIPYPIVANSVMLDLIIWTMETYCCNYMQWNVYWRNKTTYRLVVDNGNEQMLTKFNAQISPITVLKSDSKVRDNKGFAKKNCQVYSCSVLVEEPGKEAINIYKGKYYLYPAGFVAQKWVERYAKIADGMEILGFIDKSKLLQGRKIYDLEVFSPAVLNEFDSYDKVLIISNMYNEEIYQELAEKIPKEKLEIWNEFDGKLWMKNNGEIKVCSL